MGAIRDVRRIGRWLAVLMASGIVASAAPGRAADLYHDAQSARTKYAAEIEKLAQWCVQHDLKAEAKKTRDAFGPGDPYKLYLPILPDKVGTPKPPDDASETVGQWHERFWKMRQQQAGVLYDLARRAIREHQPSLAYQLVLDAVREYPDHEGARRVLGYQKYHNEWHTPYEIRKLRADLVWNEKFGWLNKVNVPRYERGERLSGGRWVTEAVDARLHRDIRSGWDIETEHYLIRTDHSIEAAVALAKKLETLHRLWRQIFIRYYASESYVEGLFGETPKAGARRPTNSAGGGLARHGEMPRFDVVYFRSQAEYNKTLRAAIPDVTISHGIYLAQNRTAYFFAGGEDTDRVMYHEATHQLFQQSRPVPQNIAQRANFWIIEGIAMYMESLHQEGGYYVLGGLDDVRMGAARYHLLDEDFYVPFDQLTRLGMKGLQTHPKIAKLYSQMAAMTSFLVYYGDGRYRDALVAYLEAVYSGNENPGVLAELTGTRYAESDKQYREYMKIRQSKPSSKSE